MFRPISLLSGKCCSHYCYTAFLKLKYVFPFMKTGILIDVVTCIILQKHFISNKINITLHPMKDL
jgi:hypothetical protein